MPHELDIWERRILALLQEDASLSTAAIAEAVGLSASPCWRRIDRLERDGIIKRRVALVDRTKIGLKAQIFAQVKLNAHGRANLDKFTAAIREVPEVMECHVLMGSVDFMLRIVAADIESYERLFFERLSNLPGVQEIIRRSPCRRSSRRRRCPSRMGAGDKAVLHPPSKGRALCELSWRGVAGRAQSLSGPAVTPLR